jgi:tetratricopeptide (TPR) repeat protein
MNEEANDHYLKGSEYEDKWVLEEDREDLEQAAAEYGRAAAIDGQNALVHLCHALMLFQLDRYQEAADAFTRALDNNRGEGGDEDLDERGERSALVERGLSYQALGDIAAARADLTRALEMAEQSDCDDFTYSSDEVKEYIAALDKGPRSGGSAPDTASEKQAEELNAQALEYSERQDYDRAIASFTSAIALDSGSAILYYNRGLAYGRKKDYDSAIADFTQAIRISSNYSQAYYNRGYLYYRKGAYDSAIADYTEVLRIDPGYAKAAEGIEKAKAARQSAAPARFCAECGTALKSGAKFCAECGTAAG